MDNVFTKPMDDSFKLAMEFMGNLKDRSAGFGNIYVARTKDKNGNITDVKFGKNVMTDYGMEHFFINSETFPNRMYIGHGSTSQGFNHTTHELLDPYDAVSTLVSETHDYAYPMYYDNVSGLITCVCRALQVKFPLEIESEPDEITITEYGIGTAIDALWTHSWVYDTAGHYGTLRKIPEEELYIDVYYCLSYYESLIQNNWTNGKYTVITTLARFFNRMDSSIVVYRRNNRKATMTSTLSRSAFQNNEITTYRNLSEYTMINTWSGNDDEKIKSGYLDGYCDYYSGFLSVERELMTTPEPFAEVVITDGHKDDCISARFGQFSEYQLPLTQATVTSCKLYDYNTHGWDNAETFLNDNDKWYTETPLQTAFAMPIYYTNNNTIMGMWLYQNINTHDAITAFDVNLTTVYACEKYWDKTTWHHISNLTSVPNNHTNDYNHTMNCQTARYYVTSADNINLIPHRTLEGLVIVPSNGRSESFGFPVLTTIMLDVFGNYDNGWYKCGNTVVSPLQNKSYDLFSNMNLSTTDAYSYGWNNWLIVYGKHVNTTTLYYVDLTDMSTKPSVSNTLLTFDTRTNFNMFDNMIASYTDTGYMTLQGIGFNTSYLIDLRGNAINPVSYPTSKMCCIWGTNRIAYISTADPTIVQVYEFGSTNAVIQTFTIPSGFTVTYMFGHTNYVWLVSNSSSVAAVCCDIITGDITNTTSAMNVVASNLSRVRVTAADDALVVYRIDTFNPNQAYWIKVSAPTSVHDLSNLGVATDGATMSRFHLHKIHVNSMVLLYSKTAASNNNNGGTRNWVIDFGNLMDGHTDYVKLESDTSNACFIPYGDYYITECHKKWPMEHWMPHKVSGTTPCITSVNNYINLRNKQFYTTFTNVPEFTGLPPGDKQ